MFPSVSAGLNTNMYFSGQRNRVVANTPQPAGPVRFSGDIDSPNCEGVRNLLLNSVLVDGKTGVDLLMQIYTTLKDKYKLNEGMDPHELTWQKFSDVPTGNLVWKLLPVLEELGLLKISFTHSNVTLTKQGLDVLKSQGRIPQ